MSFHTSFFGESWNVAFISEMNTTFVEETFGVYFMGYDQLCMHVMKYSGKDGIKFKQLAELL